MIKKGPENASLAKLIAALQKDKKAFWKRVGEILAKPKRQRVAINISKIETYASDGKIVVVPGKVLGEGDLTKAVAIAAFSFSKSAKESITKAGGKALTIDEAHKSLKDFKDVILLV